MNNIIEIENLNFKYLTRDNYALNNVSVNIKSNKTTVILGSSGSGKSTLLRLINKTLNPYSGNIEYQGLSLNKATKLQIRNIRREMGVVYQQFNLVESQTVIKNVLNGRLGYTSFIRGIFGIFDYGDYDIARDCLKKVGLTEFAGYKARSLSGGQKQRVAIARALAQKPKVILADEPVSSLDPKLMIEIMDLLHRVCLEENITLVISLHFLSLAKLYADEVVGIKGGSIVFHKTINSLNDKDLIDVYGETREWLLHGELGF